MSLQKRALIIASPFSGLEGTLNDATSMVNVFRSQGFSIEKCFGPDATRAGIIQAWRRLISMISPGDVVAIYYSGHGGYVTSPTKDGEASQGQWKYQFLVPVDFDETSENDFRGILDVEISNLVQDTTRQTKNVVVILDCCHSGRMSRDPGYGEQARPKNIFTAQYHDVERYAARLRDSGQLHGQLPLEANEDAVRIVAAAETETAWEYFNTKGQWGGAMTEALVKAIREAEGHEVSWKTTLLRVRELVNIKFPGQHPHVEGPETRAHFSLKQVTSEEIHIKTERGLHTFQAGRVAGVHEGNIYKIVSFHRKEDAQREVIAEAKAVAVAGFQAQVDLDFIAPHEALPQEGALAILKQDAMYRWPTSAPAGLERLAQMIRKSKFLQNFDGDAAMEPLAEIQHENEILSLVDRYGTKISCQELKMNLTGSEEAFSSVIVDAERLARAQWLLALQQADIELLEHDVEIEVGLVEKHKSARTIQLTGQDHLKDGDSVYIQLCNKGDTAVYVSVFNINVAGKITLISIGSPLGIVLPTGRTHTIGRDRFGILQGLEFSWPQAVPKQSSVQERLLFVVSNTSVDLRHLNESTPQLHGRRTSLSSLEKLAYRISLGATRDLAPESNGPVIQYALVHVPLTLYPRDEPGRTEPANVDDHQSSYTKYIIADQLPDPSTVPEGQDLPPYPTDNQPSNSKNLLGALIRTARRIPPCVWVVNRHTEEITVVVSKYRPDRLITEGGFNASVTGGGFNITTTPFLSPAAKKTIAPCTIAEDPDYAGCTAVFPLWTRKEGFGVITVFKGPEKELIVENDKVLAGTTVYFVNNDLKPVPY